MGHEISILPLPMDQIQEKLQQEDTFIESALERHVLLYQAPGLKAPWLRTPSAP